MKTKVIVSLMLTFCYLCASSAIAAKRERYKEPRIAAIDSKPKGKAYSEWAAKWWQWVLETDASVQPLFTDADCSEGQKGRVWFLGGTFGSGSIERECTVPIGTSLFFPIVNAGYFAFLNDPAETRTEEFIRAQVACENYVLHAVIDGVEVEMPKQYLTHSVLFDVQLPEDNLFGADESVIPELLLSPSVDQGVYLFVRPLSKGEHTIHFEGSQDCPFGSFTENVTYNITVESRKVRKSDKPSKKQHDMPMFRYKHN